MHSFRSFLRSLRQEIIQIIANVQNICNLIGREEYNIGRSVLSTS